MSDTDLFGQAVTGDKAKAVGEGRPRPGGPAKLLRAERRQVLLTPTDLEALLPGNRRVAPTDGD